ncbi:MAG TPA: Ig-like domain-containing protein [Gemmatimonadaceae bacterium]|nr:Ig-like domain-containing protein [Gemmatimonadaceae bacterium]
MRLALSLVLTVAACGGDATAPTPVALVSVSPEAHTMFVGDEIRLTATMKDAEGRTLTGRTVTWSVEPASIATVTSDGRVIGAAPGVAQVAAESEGKRDRATITIQARPQTPSVATVVVTPGTFELTEGQTQSLTAVTMDASGAVLEGRAVTWSSSDANVADVDASGKVTAKVPGSALIRASSEGKTGSAALTVRATPVGSVTLNIHHVDLAWGARTELVATVRDANGGVLSNREIIWSTTNPAIAAVTNLGQVIARGGGTATITATSEGISDAATVVVTELPGFAFDLIYDRWSGTTVIEPTLYRVDIRTVDATPHAMFDFWTSSNATASPNGDRIAFVGVDNGHTEIFLANADGSNAKRLTSGTLSADQPAWSPDGTRIAYRLSANFPPARIWAMNADGTNQHAVTNDAPGEHHHPTWSPRQADGSYRIAYAQAAIKDGYMRAQIWSVRDDGADRQIHSDESIGAYDDEPSWSPDGGKIVFVRSGQQLVVVSLPDRNERPLLNGSLDGEQRSPAWSPDGSLIAFVSSHEIDPDGYGKQIYTVRPDGSGLRRRTFDRTEKGNPAWILAR